MKFTLSWLKTHLDTTTTLNDIVLKLTAIGLEVEDVQDRAKIFEAFKVALIEKADKHPDADRLKVCVVDTGREKLQVVCGAPNARAGMKGIFAPAGSTIPGTGLLLKKGNIRGQESNGMMVSEREMGFSEAHDGIIEVDGKYDLGTPLAAIYGLDDPVIEINLTPNRADCAGIRGIARDLAAAGLGTLKPLDEKAVKGSFKSPINVTIQDTAGCPLFLGRYIRGVKNGSSPEWLQKRLKDIGLRPISALVDITNFLSYDLCRPLHVFDADKLKGNILVRTANAGEKFAALDTKIYDLSNQVVVVADDNGPQALGGIMGGVDSSCSAQTVNVFLEAAYFDPNRIARTGRDLQINSDARYRFERGIDPAFTASGVEIATRLILELCGGEASEVVKAGTTPSAKAPIKFNPAKVKQLAGVDVPAAQQEKILKSLGFAVEKNDMVSVPSWRGDVEGAADLVEEIVRINGYENIAPVSLQKDAALTENAETHSMTLSRKVRSQLAARGMNECLTWSFLHHDKAALFGSNDNPALRLANPISADLDQMRPSILPNLIEAATRNSARGYADTALFEVGPIFTSSKTVGGQSLVAAGLRSGHQGPRHWSGKDASREVDAYDVKADALAVLESCGAALAGLQVTRDAPSYYHPGRSGTLSRGRDVVAHFGELHPLVQEKLAADGAMVGFEVFLDRLPPPKRKGSARSLLTLSAFQPVQRDFAFTVKNDVEADTIVKAALSADKTLIADAAIFDVYSGKGVEDGHKSIAINVTIQPIQQTLTDPEIEALTQKIIAAVTAKTGGKLRT